MMKKQLVAPSAAQSLCLVPGEASEQGRGMLHRAELEYDSVKGRNVKRGSD